MRPASSASRPATHPALSPGRTARILRGDRPVGWLGALHPELAKRIDKKRTAVVFALQLDALTPAAVPAFERYSKFPSIRRDLAIVVAEDVSADALTKAARAAAGDILQQVDRVRRIPRQRGRFKAKKHRFRLDFAGRLTHAY